MSAPGFEPIEGDDAREVPVRVLVVQEDERPLARVRDEEWVMSFPHLIVRETVAFVVLMIFLTAVSIAFDAPLEELANPEKTPNPSKAPWYFLGLQELLHYYPPLVSGVLMPGALIVALIVVPYFNINVERVALWKSRPVWKGGAILAVVAGITVIFFFTGAHPVWPLIGTTWFIGFFMLLPGVVGPRGSAMRWLGTRSVAFWVFCWFIIASTVLTVIGVYFRGPGWSLTLPWRDGVF